MRTITVEIQIEVRWWLIPYCRALYWFADLAGMEVDPERLDAVIERGLKVVVK